MRWSALAAMKTVTVTREALRATRAGTDMMEMDGWSSFVREQIRRSGLVVCEKGMDLITKVTQSILDKPVPNDTCGYLTGLFSASCIT
jgi:hypothetical protein